MNATKSLVVCRLLIHVAAVRSRYLLNRYTAVEARLNRLMPLR